MAESQEKAEHLVCPRCGHDNNTCSNCGYALKAPIKSVTVENVARDVNIAKRAVITIPPQSDDAVGILQRTPSGDCKISTVSNLILTQQHTTIKLEPHTKPVRVHIAASTEELQSATDGVMILRADWSDLSISGKQAHSSLTTEKSEDQPVQRDVVMTRLIGKHTEEFFAEVMKVIQREDLPEKVLKDLYQRFQLRLLGLTKRLEFLMEVDRSKVPEIMQLEAEVQQTLVELVPKQRRQEVTWESFSHVPVQCSEQDEATGQAIMGPDSGNTKPKRAFIFELTAADDADETDHTYITAIVASDDNKLFLADCNNRRVKALDLENPATTSASDILQEGPWCLALLGNQRLVVTTGTHTLYFLSGDEHVVLNSAIQTRRKYWGVAGSTDDTLVVSCRLDTDRPASVDVITLQGDIVRTIVDSATLPQLEWPDYLCADGDRIFLADSWKETVLIVDKDTGELLDAPAYVENPRQIAVDTLGNIYVASSTHHALLKKLRAGWQEEILKGPEDSAEGQEIPRAVCVTNSLLVVAWRGVSKINRVITGHYLRY